MGSGCEILIAAKNAFVRQTTPHFGGTLREGLYSVRAYHTPWGAKSKYLFKKYWYIFIDRRLLLEKISPLSEGAGKMLISIWRWGVFFPG